MSSIYTGKEKRSLRSTMQEEAGIAGQIANARPGDRLFRADDALDQMTFAGRPMLELLMGLKGRGVVIGADHSWTKAIDDLNGLKCETVTDKVEPYRALRAFVRETSAQELYAVNSADLTIDSVAKLEDLNPPELNPGSSKDWMYRFDATSTWTQRAVDALCRQQMALEMSDADYLNAKVSVNFPLDPFKLGNYATIPGYQLVGHIDAESRLRSFGLYFLGQPPEFAGGLMEQAHSYSQNRHPKAYLYLVLVRPDSKGKGFFEAIYDQLDTDCKRHNLAGCAIEIHQSNTRSILAHEKIGFEYMGTHATHTRTDAQDNVRDLIYGQYYRANPLGWDAE